MERSSDLRGTAGEAQAATAAARPAAMGRALIVRCGAVRAVKLWSGRLVGVAADAILNSWLLCSFLSRHISFFFSRVLDVTVEKQVAHQHIHVPCAAMVLEHHQQSTCLKSSN